MYLVIKKISFFLDILFKMNQHILIVLSLLVLNANCGMYPGYTQVDLQNFQIYYLYNQSTFSTDFIVVSQTTKTSLSESNAWIAFGLNAEPQMESTTVVVCKSTPFGKQVQHYYNNGFTPEMLDKTNPTIGLTNAKFIFNNTNMICSFTKKNVVVNSRYFNIIQGNDPYFLIAYSIMGGNNYSKI